MVKPDTQNTNILSLGYMGMVQQYGLVNPQGNFVVPLGMYDEIYEHHDNGLITVRKNDKYGFVNTKGEVAIPLMYDYVNGGFEHGMVSVSKKGKFGIIDVRNQALIPFEYDNLAILDNLTGQLYFRATNNGKSALLNQKNKAISKFEYDLITPIYRSNLFVVTKNHRYGVIDDNATLVVPIEYDFVQDTLQSTDPYNFDLPKIYIQASKNDNHYLFDKQGKFIQQPAK